MYCCHRRTEKQGARTINKYETLYRYHTIKKQFLLLVQITLLK